MKIEDLQQLIGLGTALVQESCETLFSVLVRPQAFFRAVTLGTTAGLFRASRFAALRCRKEIT